jgi:hypothetical protein
MSSFALSSRSTCVRLVFSSMAVLFFEILFFFIASASCQATTSFDRLRLRFRANAKSSSGERARRPPETHLG